MNIIDLLKNSKQQRRGGSRVKRQDQEKEIDWTIIWEIREMTLLVENIDKHTELLLSVEKKVNREAVGSLYRKILKIV